MDTKAILSYSRQLLHRYKSRAINLSRRILPQRKMLIFAFGGRAHHWVGIGSDLYSGEKVFRDYIQKCDSIIQELGGNSILANFEKKAKSDFFEDESNVIFTLTSFQIALFEWFKSKDILPNAVMGISLGEIAAVYAAGGISLKDALKLASGVAYISRKEKNEFVVLYLQTDLSNANCILKKCPVAMSVVYEVSDNSVLAYCHKDHRDTVGDFLKSQNISWHAPFKTLSYPYHTDLLLRHQLAVREFTKDIAARPLQCNFYSSVFGKMIPEGTIIENDFWFHLPVQAHSLLQQVAVSGREILLQIGPSAFSDKHLTPMASLRSKNRPRLLFTVLPEVPELKLLKKVKHQLLRTRWHSSSLIIYRNDNEFQKFRERLNLGNPNFYSNLLLYLRYLKKEGNVHYLPQQDEWIVVDYALAEHILKTPEIFSSTIHHGFDKFLLGADPPSHTFVRSLMQPFFTQQRFNMIAQCTSIIANDLLEKLEQKTKFNLVDEFSIPLSQAVFAKFMGFTEEEERSFKNTIKQHPYELQFFDALKEFSKEYLETLQSNNECTVGSVLLGFVKDDKISFDTAVSLFRLLCVAGTVTTSILVSSAILLLSQNSDLYLRVKEDEQALTKFIEECLRLEAPESEVKRITTREIELDGQVIPQGSVIVLKLNAMNRDRNYFGNPDSIDLNRPEKKHLSFSGGYHFCLGAGMARTEAKVAIKTFLEKFTLLRIDPEGTEYFPSPHFRALQKLMIVARD